MISQGLQASCPINVSDITHHLDDLTYGEGPVDRQAQELKPENEWVHLFSRYEKLEKNIGKTVT